VTKRRTAETSQSGPWLSASLRWPGDEGPWLLTAHWAKLDGGPAIVGLDIRSYTEADSARYPVSDDLAEVTQRVLRGITISTIRDTTREALIRDSEHLALGVFSVPLNAEGEPDGEPPIARHPELMEHAGRAMERLQMLTVKGEPRKRRPAATEMLLRRVAALYAYAVGVGDKAPARYVEQQLRADGEHRLSHDGESARVLVRQWIRRARERGYLAPVKGEK
jgi:hypothetical protein